MVTNLFYLYMILFTVFMVAESYYYEKETYDLFMPHVQPQKANKYLCTPVKVNPHQSYYIVGFQPNASMDIVHHMIVYGCSKPGLSEYVWNCGRMSSSESDDMPTAEPCASGETILYAWARNAPELQLPDKVAFKIGKNSNLQYMVLQIHYNHVDHFKDGDTDSSGVLLHYTTTPMPRLAGILLLGTGGMIRPHSLESMETAYEITEDKAIHPFAFRVHTHELGYRVTGYRVRRKNNIDHWTLIGTEDPMCPQMFYPVEDKNMVIQKGDVVAASCKMNASEKDHHVLIGTTSNDEMCNFYIMYWVEDASPLEQEYYFSSGPPYYYWKYDLLFNNIPLTKEKPTVERKCKKH